MDAALRHFAEFLTKNWTGVRASTQGLKAIDANELLADWAQANWELLVEPHLREQVASRESFLEPYGDGAECNGSSSRVWLPDAMPTHRIVCRQRGTASFHDLLTDRVLEPPIGTVVLFEQFATRADGGWYKVDAPFDCVLGYLGEQEVLIPLEQVAFFAESTERS
jgi:hypothetical protein